MFRAREIRSKEASETSVIPSYTIDSIRKVLKAYGAENVLLVMLPEIGLNDIKSFKIQTEITKIFENELKSGFKSIDISESCKLPNEFWGVSHPNFKGYQKLQ